MAKNFYPLVIVGSGGHGREAYDVALDTGDYWVEGFVSDDEPPKGSFSQYDFTWLGGTEFIGDSDSKYVIAIGNCSDKERVARRLERYSSRLTNLIHPSAYVGSYCNFGSGVMVYAGAKITTNVWLGDHVNLNTGSIVSHDCVIGDYSTISPGAIINGNVKIGKGVFVGTGAIILPKIIIGDGVTIGAGAVVTKDLIPNQTYIGVPARRLVK